MSLPSTETDRIDLNIKSAAHRRPVYTWTERLRKTEKQRQTEQHMQTELCSADADGNAASTRAVFVCSPSH